MAPNIHTFPVAPAAAAAATEPRTPGERLRRGGGWLALVLTLVMILSMGGAVNAAAWSEALEAVQLAGLAGVLLGFALALTRWTGFFPVFYSLLTGLTWTVVLINRFFLGSRNAHDAVQLWVQRNNDWFYALFTGNPSADNLIFVTQLSLLAWWIGYFAIWSVFRHQRVLYAAVPAGVGLLVNAYYSPKDLSPYLFVFLASVVLLAIRVELARNETYWQVARVRYASDIGLDFLWAGVIFSAVVISLAWTLPNLSDTAVMEQLRRPFERPWKQVENTWSRMYQSLRYEGPPVELVTGFSKDVTLGGPVELTDRPIFQARSVERSYWRASAFDRYTGTGWQNTDNGTLTLDRNRPLGEPTTQATHEITVTIQILEARQDVIFAAPQPVRVSVPIDADVTVLSAPDEPRQVVVSLIRSRVPIQRGGVYQVVSAITDATPEMLRSDTTNYPNWVRARYLQVPESLPRRVRQLALRLAQGHSNPYDIATAIEGYLRNYPYNQQIAAPPAGADAVDYFLFNVRQGYCDYYASAMVMLLRVAGVPARLVTGYTPGQPLERANEERFPGEVYLIRELNSHAWVEVYFPTYGWIQFEPTASEPPLTRPQPRPTPGPVALPNIPRNLPEPDEGDALFPDQSPRQRFQSGPESVAAWLLARWPFLVAAGLLAVTLVGGWLWLRYRRRQLLADPQLLVRLFAVLARWAGRLRVPWPASHTPFEHALAFGRVAPEAEHPVRRIANLYVAQQYGREMPPTTALESLIHEWDAVQPALWRRWAWRLAPKWAREWAMGSGQ